VICAIQGLKEFEIASDGDLPYRLSRHSHAVWNSSRAITEYGGGKAIPDPSCVEQIGIHENTPVVGHRPNNLSRLNVVFHRVSPSISADERVERVERTNAKPSTSRKGLSRNS
jgi:hypothetical protein